MVEPKKTLPDGTKIYSWNNLDDAFNEVEEVDLTVSDLILFLLWCDKDKPIFGNTRLVKEAFVFWNELTQRGYKVEDPHFFPYRYGPYSKFIMATVEDLYFAGFIVIATAAEKRQYVYMLSKKGVEEAENLVKEKIREEDREYFKRKRRSLDKLKPRKLKEWVYQFDKSLTQGKYISRSEIKDKLDLIPWGSSMIKAVEIEQVEKIYSFYVRKLRIKTNFGTIETPRLSFTTTDINYLIDVPTTIDIRDDIVVLTNLRWLSPEAILNKDSYIDRAKKNLYEIKQKVSGQTKIIIPYIYATKKYIASLNYEEKKKFIVKAIEYQQELNFSDIVIPDMKLPLDSHGKFLGELAAQYDNVNLIPIVSDDNLQVLKYVIEKERFNTVIINFGKKENMDYYRALSNDILKYKDKNIFILGVGSTNTVKIPASQGIADLAPLQLFTPFLGIDSTLTIPSIPYKEQRPKNVNEKYQKIKQTINRLRVLDPITLKYTTFVELKEKLVEYMQTIRKYVRVDDDEVLKYDILPNLPSLYEIPSPDDIERLELYEKKLERVRKLFKVLNTCMLETEYNTLSNYISQGRVKEYLRKRKIIDKVIGADITRFSEE